MELIKNVIASIPLLLAMLIGYIIQPFLSIAKQLSKLGVFAHEKLQTKLGKQLTAKRLEIKKQMEILQELQNKMQVVNQESSTLSNIIKGNSPTEKVTPGGNVFVLGKKPNSNGDSDSGSET
jgi:uncharacterized coiled-coil protein SlyX